jgi:transposase
VLEQAGRLEATAETQAEAKKLRPFHDAIEKRVALGLTTSRILREIKELGYPGGRTILANYVRPLRAKLALGPQKGVKRRFETAPGQEMQIDWSPYRVSLDGRVTRVHALGCLLCTSRKLHLRFYRDERQATLLEALATAFAYFDGVAHRVVLDNMATAVLGRIGADRQPIWHDRFVAFACHYGFAPFACKVRDPDRKGKKEKSFRYLWDDFLKGSEFASWDDLHRRCAVWLDETPEVGNLRIHGTTRRVPNEAYAEERPLLIRLPEHRFPVHEDGVRDVDRDATLSIHGTRYTVPSALAGRSVAVRLFAEHFEVVGPAGQIAWSRRYVADRDKGKLQIDPTHYANVPRGRGPESGERLDEAFRRRFPDLAPLVEGIQRRMKALAPVHLRALLRLCDRFGEPAFRDVCRRLQEARRFDAGAVRRVLEREHPLIDEDAPPSPLGGQGPLLLGEVEPASLDDYQPLDRQPPTAKPPGQEDDHGA